MPERPKVRVVLDRSNVLDPRVYVDDVRVPGLPDIDIKRDAGYYTPRPPSPLDPLEIRGRSQGFVVQLTYRSDDLEVQYVDAAGETLTDEQRAAITADLSTFAEPKRPPATGGYVSAAVAADAYTDAIYRLCHSPGPTPEQLAKLRADVEALGGTITHPVCSPGSFTCAHCRGTYDFDGVSSDSYERVLTTHLEQCMSRAAGGRDERAPEDT